MTQPAAQPAASDKVTLWGVLGIVFALCCPILGIVFSILSMLEAKKVGKPNTLAIVGFVIAGLNIVLAIVLNVAGLGFYGMNR